MKQIKKSYLKKPYLTNKVVSPPMLITICNDFNYLKIKIMSNVFIMYLWCTIKCNK